MDYFREYLANCQFAGLRFVAHSGRHWIERLFWVICVAMSWYFSVLLFVDYWQSYVNNPLSFVTETDYVHWNTSFFSVTVCEDKNDHSIRKLTRELYGKDFNNSNNMEEVLLEIAHFRGTGAFIKKYCLEWKRDCPQKDLKSIVNKARRPCPEVFLRCYWHDNPFDCCKYFVTMETELGICYSINSIQTKKREPFDMISNVATGAGTLRLLLMIPSTVYIHAPEDVPFLNSKDTEILISTADLYKRYSYRILDTVNEPLVRDVSIDQRQCRYPDDNILKMHSSYSYSACIVECRAKKQIELCNCSSHLVNFADKPCDLLGLNCLQQHLTEHASLTNDGLKCDCLPSCMEPQYDFIDYETYGGVGEHAEIELTLSGLPTVRLKRQVVRGALDLVVSIGGTAGLFAGASMLSFVELIYYFLIRPLWKQRE